ncbi:MAG: acyloxyacyl hydrolase [Leptolyngbya sp. PLA3]|nr:MAG: acyloxyacyl hydrolase [Cyanobacteria bacterium CYA]MCE7967576.1 acyloxyacyl hydrolase [Leptolyngbya sp. PL-A3]
MTAGGPTGYAVPMKKHLLGITLMVLATSTAWGLDAPTLTQPDLALQTEEPVAQPFGVKGQTRLTIGTGVAFEVEDDDDSTDFNINVAWSRFLVDDIEMRLELGGWYFDQESDGAWGINPNFVLRWHLINKERWTFFADAGIGVLFSTDDVPPGGTSANFTPRAGAGITHKIGARGQRAELGVRWHHISNARLTGDSDNPDRDGVMVYAGISFPF